MTYREVAQLVRVKLCTVLNYAVPAAAVSILPARWWPQ
jgi:hypothetical protein